MLQPSTTGQNQRSAPDLLFDGPSAFPEMERAVAAPSATVNVMFYIFRTTKPGGASGFARRARAGHAYGVRVLIDAWGSPRFPAIQDPLRAAGRASAAFLPSHF